MPRHVTPELQAEFTSEAQKLLGEIGPVVVCLDAADRHSLKLASRGSHRLKGVAQLLKLSTLSHVAGIQEEVLESVRTKKRPLTDEVKQLIDATFQASVMCIHSPNGCPPDEASVLASVIIPYRRLNQLPVDGDQAAIREHLPINLAKVAKAATATAMFKSKAIEKQKSSDQSSQSRLTSAASRSNASKAKPVNQNVVSQTTLNEKTGKQDSHILGSDILNSDLLSSDILNAHILNSDILNSDILNSHILNSHILNSGILGSHNTSSDIHGSDNAIATSSTELRGVAAAVRVESHSSAAVTSTGKTAIAPIEQKNALDRFTAELDAIRMSFEQRMRKLNAEQDELRLGLERVQELAIKLSADVKNEPDSEDMPSRLHSSSLDDLLQSLNLPNQNGEGNSPRHTSSARPTHGIESCRAR